MHRAKEGVTGKDDTALMFIGVKQDRSFDFQAVKKCRVSKRNAVEIGGIVDVGIGEFSYTLKLRIIKHEVRAGVDRAKERVTGKDDGALM